MGRHKSKDSITTTRPSAKAKQIFAGKVFFLCGDVTVDVRFTKAAIERYIDQRGGKVAQQMSNDIDYLVCTIATFNEKPSPVKQAMSLRKTCKVVTWEFIEDCIHEMKDRGKLLHTANYELHNVQKRVDKALTEQARLKKKYGAEGLAYAPLVDPKFWSIDMDQEFFEYKVTLTRLWAKTQGKEGSALIRELFILYHFKSRALPYTYKVGVIFKRDGESHKYHREYLVDRDYYESFIIFKTIFKSKTGIEWDDRCDGLAKPNENSFVYLPPQGGKPVGVLPPGKPVVKEIEKEVSSETENTSDDDSGDTENHYEDSNESDSVEAMDSGEINDRMLYRYQT